MTSRALTSRLSSRGERSAERFAIHRASDGEADGNRCRGTPPCSSPSPGPGPSPWPAKGMLHHVQTMRRMRSPHCPHHRARHGGARRPPRCRLRGTRLRGLRGTNRMRHPARRRPAADPRRPRPDPRRTAQAPPPQRTGPVPARQLARRRPRLPTRRHRSRAANSTPPPRRQHNPTTAGPATPPSGPFPPCRSGLQARGSPKTAALNGYGARNAGFRSRAPLQSLRRTQARHATSYKTHYVK